MLFPAYYRSWVIVRLDPIPPACCWRFCFLETTFKPKLFVLCAYENQPSLLNPGQLSSLESTLAQPTLSADSNTLTGNLSSLESTLTKNPGVAVIVNQSPFPSAAQVGQASLPVVFRNSWQMTLNLKRL